MNFSLDKFLRPLADSDRSVQIYNVSDIVKYTINPFSVTRLNISNNLLNVNLKYNKVISLDFRTTNEAKAALIKFQEQLDLLRKKVPYVIDKQIQNYVDYNDDNNTLQNQPSASSDILVENIWIESNLIPTDLTDALSSTIVSSMSSTMSWVNNTYSFKINSPDSNRVRVVPDNYGSFYEPLLFSSLDMSPISATGIPYWKLSDDIVTFYGGFPSVPVVNPTNPPIIKYFKYTGRFGTFNLIGGSTNIIEATGMSSSITLPSIIRRDNIISVTINGVLVYRWSYVGNNLIIDESSIGYLVEPTDLIRIETNVEPGGSFSTI